MENRWEKVRLTEQIEHIKSFAVTLFGGYNSKATLFRILEKELTYPSRYVAQRRHSM